MTYKLERIDLRFYNELKEIINNRLSLHNENKKSIRWVTNMIIKHNFWKQIKQEIEEYEE